MSKCIRLKTDVIGLKEEGTLLVCALNCFYIYVPFSISVALFSENWSSEERGGKDSEENALARFARPLSPF